VDEEREKLMEDVIISQAPRSLQIDVAKMIKHEKLLEASRKIGVNRQGVQQSGRFQKNS